MNSIPFNLPESLQGYVKTFQSSPKKGIANLEQYVSKRRLDPVGYFLLAILLHENGQEFEALKAATKAKALAPGSALMENLQYYLSHPKGFEAWVPPQKRAESNNRRKTSSELSIDLDTLISRLTRAGSKRIKISENSNGFNLDTESAEVEKLATPTLALIYERQGKIDEALRVYMDLIQLRPENKAHFQSQIERIMKHEG